MSDETIQRYEKMLAEDPQSRAFAPLAEAHRKAGRLDEAINVARTGLEIHPDYSGGLVVLGRALYEKDELDNAAEILQKAVSESPESYLGQKFLGKILMDKGESKGALRALEAANLLSPEDEEVARLLDEVKSKATVPETMEYRQKEAEDAEKAQIVTYEQKPTTIDGIELPPLSASGTDDTFSFSGGGTVDPADITPVPVEEVSAPVTEAGEVAAQEVAEEDMTATVIEEEEVEQAMEIESLDELGPEAAAFIMEGEAAEEDLGEVLPEVIPEPASPSAFAEATADKEATGDKPEVAPPPAPEPIPEPTPEPIPPPEPEPAPVSIPEPIPEAAPAPEPVSEFAPTPESESVPEPPPQETAGEEQFSTETMADLYAQQGLIGKAVSIYRQILQQDPANETVKLKLDALETPEPSDQSAVPEEIQPPPSESPATAPQAEEEDEALKTLEDLLENVERIKRP